MPDRRSLLGLTTSLTSLRSVEWLSAARDLDSLEQVVAEVPVPAVHLERLSGSGILSSSINRCKGRQPTTANQEP
jgi:hypothetical protein